MKALVLAHGDGRRWDDYLGGPKQLVVQIDGESLLERTVRMLRARDVGDIVVVAPDDRFAVTGAELAVLDDPAPTGCDQDKFLATRHLWAAAERTTLLWGDCYYSDDALDQIVACDDDYHVFRRPGRSTITGHEWDESFAVTFLPERHDDVVAAADRVVDAWKRGRLKKGTHIRTHYAAMIGLGDQHLDSVKAVANGPHQTHIDDWTEDFDRPDEWSSWMGRRYAGAHKVAVCVPWVEGDQWRNWSRAFVHEHWARLGVPVFYGGCGTGQFVNRSAGRNAAVVAARAAIPDVEAYFFADADTFVDADQFWAAVHHAIGSGQLVRAFTEYVKADQRSTARLRSASTGKLTASRRMTNHSSGAIAVSRKLVEQVGGHDERFESWGGEDRAFWLACHTLAGWGPSVPGTAWHLWHPTSPERNQRLLEYQANVELAMRYKRAAGVQPRAGILPELPKAATTPQWEPDPDEMCRILTEPGGPLDPDLVERGVPVTPRPFDTPPAPSRRSQLRSVEFVNVHSGRTKNVVASGVRKYDQSACWVRADDAKTCETCGQHLQDRPA